MGKEKSLVIAYLLLIFLGWVGAHRFYFKKFATGCFQLGLLLMFFFFHGMAWVCALLLWLIIDLFLIPKMNYEYGI
jgi:TM2 domain-containing membrane protein YozV